MTRRIAASLLCGVVGLWSCGHSGSSAASVAASAPDSDEEPLLTDYSRRLAPSSQRNAGAHGPVVAVAPTEPVDEPVDTPVTANAGSTEAMLEPSQGGGVARLSVKTSKRGRKALKGCMVEVGGQRVGQALQVAQVPAGRQTVAVRCRGRGEIVRTMELAASRTTSFVLKKGDIKRLRKRRR